MGGPKVGSSSAALGLPFESPFLWCLALGFGRRLGDCFHAAIAHCSSNCHLASPENRPIEPSLAWSFSAVGCRYRRHNLSTDPAEGMARTAQLSTRYTATNCWPCPFRKQFSSEILGLWNDGNSKLRKSWVIGWGQAEFDQFDAETNGVLQGTASFLPISADRWLSAQC